MSTIKANDIQNASGGIPTVKGQKLIPTAWVNFQGTSTVAIRDSENVSSITDNGVGIYTVNFAVGMSSTDYCPVGGAAHDATGGGNASDNDISLRDYATSSLKAYCYRGTITNWYDARQVTIVILGGQA